MAVATVARSLELGNLKEGRGDQGRLLPWGTKHADVRRNDENAISTNQNRNGLK